MNMIALIKWLLKEENFKCPRCNYPILSKNEICDNCGQPLSSQ